MLQHVWTLKTFTLKLYKPGYIYINTQISQERQIYKDREQMRGCLELGLDMGTDCKMSNWWNEIVPALDCVYGWTNLRYGNAAEP